MRMMMSKTYAYALRKLQDGNLRRRRNLLAVSTPGFCFAFLSEQGLHFILTWL